MMVEGRYAAAGHFCQGEEQGQVSEGNMRDDNAVTGLCSDKLAQINKPVYKAASDFPCASVVPH